MKNIIKIFTISTLVGLLSCEDVETLTPVPATGASSYSAKFLFMNASPDAPSLDVYVNNIKTGASVATGVGHTSYNTVAISSNAIITAAANTTASVLSGLGSNTNIRTKATTGTIGGTLGTSDLIYRAGNNNSNNFLAVNGASYTVFVVDTVSRPKPYRTLRTDATTGLKFGDATYYSTKNSFTALKKVGVGDTTIYLNVENFGIDNNSTGAFASNNSIDAFNLVKKYNGNVNPSFMITLGTVPLGSSDPGGLRYLVVTDEWPLPSTLRLPVPTTNRFAARFINLSPDAGTATAAINGTNLPGGLFSYPLTQGNFNPTVGSRNTTGSGSSATPVIAAFTNNFGGLAPGNYAISTNAAAASLPYDFADGGIYTVVLTGSSLKGTLILSVIKHN